MKVRINSRPRPPIRDEVGGGNRTIEQRCVESRPVVADAESSDIAVELNVDANPSRSIRLALPSLLGERSKIRSSV